MRRTTPWRIWRRASGRSSTPGAIGVRRRSHSGTPRAANSYERSRRRSPGKSGVHHSWSSKLAAFGHPHNAAGSSHRRCPVRRAAVRRPGQQPRRMFLQCAHWLTPASMCRTLRPWHHDASEPKTWRQALTPESIASTLGWSNKLDDSPAHDSRVRDSSRRESDTSNAGRTSPSLSNGIPSVCRVEVRHSLKREPGSSAQWLSVCSVGRSNLRMRQKRRSKRNSRSYGKSSWTIAHRAANRGKEKDETSDRRTARKTRLCLNN